MKKEEFKNGDIIVFRNGDLGLYLQEWEIILFQEDGYDELDDYNDALEYEPAYDENDHDYDMMQIFRDPFGGPPSFFDYEENMLVYERDRNWRRPGKEERKAAREALEAARAAARAEQEKRMEEARKRAEIMRKNGDLLTVVIQALYGNRVITEMRKEDIDKRIHGILSDVVPMPEKIGRTMIRVPDTENLVFVYDKYAEEEERQYHEELIRETGRGLKPLAEIPEENIVLYSRCLVCRLRDDGALASLEDEDFEKFMHYLAE